QFSVIPLPRRKAADAASSDGPENRRTFSVRAAIRSGARDDSAYFLRQPTWYEVETLRRRFDRPYYNTPAGVEIDGQTIYQPYIHSLSITGPYQPVGSSDLPSRRRIFICSAEGV